MVDYWYGVSYAQMETEFTERDSPEVYRANFILKCAFSHFRDSRGNGDAFPHTDKRWGSTSNLSSPGLQVLYLAPRLGTGFPKHENTDIHRSGFRPKRPTAPN